MDFQVKMLENGRKKIFRDNETRNKVTLILLDVNVITKNKIFHF